MYFQCNHLYVETYVGLWKVLVHQYVYMFSLFFPLKKKGLCYSNMLQQFFSEYFGEACSSLFDLLIYLFDNSAKTRITPLIFSMQILPKIYLDIAVLFGRQRNLLGTLLEYLKYLTSLGKDVNQCLPNLQLTMLIWRVRVVIVMKMMRMKSWVDLGRQFCRQHIVFFDILLIS